MADEGFHEIQLNGKQLIFLFMAAAVVGVVVFLSGVMVGRGVRSELSATTEAPAFVPDTAPAPAAGTGTTGAEKPAAGVAANPAAPPATPPPPVTDELSYYDRLEGKANASETAKTPSEAPPAVPAAKPSTPAAESARPAPAGPEKPASAAPPATTTAVRTPPAGATGFSVQVIALRDRAASAAIAERLAGKGYNAYVLEPEAGGRSTLYRVRVGPYKTRGEADEARRRLEKEEKFKPSITR